MSVLAMLSSDAQLTDSYGIVTRVHFDPETGKADGYEVVAPIELFVAVGAHSMYILGGEGWRRFLSPEGIAYVHASAEEVEELALLLAGEAKND